VANYILSLEAQSNLQSIKTYSVKNFGSHRTKKYLQAIQSCMQKLAANPLQGIERNELKPGYFSFFVGSHTIYYRIKPNNIEIIAVLHQSMEPTKHII